MAATGGLGENAINVHSAAVIMKGLRVAHWNGNGMSQVDDK